MSSQAHAAAGRRWDPWAWYMTRWPGWVIFFLPLFLSPLPALAAALVLPVPSGELIGRLLTLEVIGLALSLNVAIPAGLALNFTWWLVLGTLLWAQGLFLIWLVSNIDLLRRWRPLDTFFRRQEKAAVRLYEVRPWIRRFHFVGILVFTFLPLGSGLIISTLVGKLTGMSDRRLLLSVFVGTALWAGLVTLAFAFSIPVVARWVDKLGG